MPLVPISFSDLFYLPSVPFFFFLLCYHRSGEGVGSRISFPNEIFLGFKINKPPPIEKLLPDREAHLAFSCDLRLGDVRRLR
jgi:hypothetical protein